jgi:hypothetical protein
VARIGLGTIHAEPQASFGGAAHNCGSILRMTRMKGDDQQHRDLNR